MSGAITVSVGLALSGGWLRASRLLMPEVTAAALLIGAVSTCRFALGSRRGALFFAVLTIVAWMTRVNLLVIAPAFILAAVFELGVCAAYRSGPLRTYVTALLVLYLGVEVIHRQIYGVSPYAHYGLMSALALAATAIVAYGGYSDWRYPLPRVVLLWFLAGDFLAWGAFAAGDLLRPTRLRSISRRAAPALPLAVVLLIWGSQSAADQVRAGRRDWSQYSTVGVDRRWRTPAVSPSPLSDYVPDDAIVAAVDPCAVLFWCGNAGYLLPRDLQGRELVDGWLEEKDPRVIVASRDGDFDDLRAHPHLRPIGFAPPYEVYAVDGASGRWTGPDALATRGGVSGEREGEGADASARSPRVWRGTGVGPR